ncbi:uncharacterized protein LOC143462425 [Clavelina lepadiformis]|uniref:Sushi domain-containing protein n=1 Tax=Clavelina lepadiformis TaxID=159417 RepID=A0ABP0GLH5_CLALP
MNKSNFKQSILVLEAIVLFCSLTNAIYVTPQPRNIYEDRELENPCEHVESGPDHRTMYVVERNGITFACCAANRNQRIVEDCRPEEPWTTRTEYCAPRTQIENTAHNEIDCYPKDLDSKDNNQTDISDINVTTKSEIVKTSDGKEDKSSSIKKSEEESCVAAVVVSVVGTSSLFILMIILSKSCLEKQKLSRDQQ